MAIQNQTANLLRFVRNQFIMFSIVFVSIAIVFVLLVDNKTFWSISADAFGGIHFRLWALLAPFSF
jgi:uncharacterized membrane protein